MEQLKEIAAYCAANIEDWDLKVEQALRDIGRRMPVRSEFRNEIEDCIEEWCDDNEVCYDEVDWDDAIDGEDGIIWEE